MNNIKEYEGYINRKMIGEKLRLEPYEVDRYVKYGFLTEIRFDSKKRAHVYYDILDYEYLRENINTIEDEIGRRILDNISRASINLSEKWKDEEFRKNRINGIKNYWTDERKLDRSVKQKGRYRRPHTKEERRIISEKTKEAMNRIEPEKKIEMLKNKTIGTKRFWENASDEYKKSVGYRLQGCVSEEGREKTRIKLKGRKCNPEGVEKQRIAVKKYWSNKSYEEIEEWGQKFRDIWNNLSNEEKFNHAKKSAENTPFENTSIEIKMRGFLESIGVGFDEQRIIGKYRPDFVVGDRIVIECDGDYFHNILKQRKSDMEKDCYLRSIGYNVIRVWEHEIKKDVRDALLSKIRVEELVGSGV